LSKEPLENGLRPAVSYLFRSVAKACGANAVGILLSGMGADGAAELALLKSQGAVTIAQNRQSCVVASMPGQAITLDGATLELAPEHIADTLMGLVGGGGTAP
jgi:two-component system chemotaxis response regulator CheB